MDTARRTKISKYLSKHLRHEPERLGLTLVLGGWVGVDELLDACAGHSFPITRTELDEVVATSDKQRFSFDPSGECIRANQGHSATVDLQLVPVAPPDVLYHGTAQSSVESILAQGLQKMSRHHMHLSIDVQTARKVGARHGKPIVFAVDAVGMSRAGQPFFCAANGVWLVDTVPAAFLQLLA